MRGALTTEADRRPRYVLAAPRFRISAKTNRHKRILGAEQKAWFLERLRGSQGDLEDLGQHCRRTLDMRADPQNLPDGIDQAVAGRRLRRFGGGDLSSAYVERGEIYDFVCADNGITGFATVAGDRHSFWAGLAAKSLPPKTFEPVGVAFMTGSISAPGIGGSIRT